MPQLNTVSEPEKVHVFWFGEEMNDQAKAGLGEINQRFPNSTKQLWAQPRRRPGETGRVRAEQLFEQYRSEAEPHGFEVKRVSDHVGHLAKAVNPSRAANPKYDENSIRDVLAFEMGNQGYIAGKDFTVMAVLGTEGGLAVDLSHHHMRGAEWEEITSRENFDPSTASFDFSTAEMKIVDLTHGESTNMRHVLHAGYERDTERHYDALIEPQMMPQFDVFAMYARPGTDGQKAFQHASQQYLSYYAQMAREQEKAGNVTFNPGDGNTRFRPDTVTLTPDNTLGSKANTQDSQREDIIGRMAVSAVVDGMYLTYGSPVPSPADDRSGKPVMPTMELTADQVKDLTMRAYETNTGRVLPQLSMVKEFGNSWRKDSVRDATNLDLLAKDAKVTVVQASNLGVRKAAELGREGALDKAAHLPYDVTYSTSADNSPRRTPSPKAASPDVQQLAADVAGLDLQRNAMPGASGPTTAPPPGPARPNVTRSQSSGM